MSAPSSTAPPGTGTAYVAHARQIDAVALSDGERRWSTAIPSANPYPIVSAALLDAGDRVVLNDFGEVMAFDKATGRRLWLTTLPDHLGLEFVVMGQTEPHVYVPGNGGVSEVAVADGRITRRFELPPDPEGFEGLRVPRNPLVYRGVLYVPSASGSDREAFYGHLTAFDLTSGRTLWDLRFPDYYYESGERALGTAYGLAPAGDLVVVTTDVVMHGVDAATGEVRWSTPRVDQGGFTRAPTVVDGAVYVGAVARWLYKLDAATGEELWRYRTNGSFEPLPEVSSGRVWVTDAGFGQVHAVDAETGRRLFMAWPPGGGRQSGEAYLSPIAVGADRAVVASTDGVYGLAIPD